MTFFLCPKVNAYYKKNTNRSVTIYTKALDVGASIDNITYISNAEQVVVMPITIDNDSDFAINYTITLSNPNLRFLGGNATYTGIVNANSNPTIDLEIVEVVQNGTDLTDVTLTLNRPYSEEILVGSSYELVFDIIPPDCEWGNWTKTYVKPNDTDSITLTCTDDGSGVNMDLALADISLNESNLGSLISVTKGGTATNRTYEFTFKAASASGTTTITLPSNVLKDNANNIALPKTSGEIIVDSSVPTLSLSVPDGETYSKSNTATIKIEDSGGSGLSGSSQTIRYVWSTTNVTSCNATAMPNTVTISTEAGASSATKTVTINDKTGAGKLYICNVEVINDRAGNSVSAGQIRSTNMYLDNTAPTVNDIGGGTALKASTQTLTLKCSDSVGITAYYFGGTEPTSLSNITTTTSADLASLSGTGLSKTINSDGTYWLGCRDSSGNFAKKSIVINKYQVQSVLEKIAGTTGTYTTSNYATSGSLSTYYVKQGTTLTLSSIYTVPTESSLEIFKGYSTSAPNSTAKTLITTNPVINGTTTYYMWFDRSTYTVTVTKPSNGVVKAETITQTGNSVTASNAAVTLIVKYGDTVKGTATANTGWHFNGWSGGYLAANTTNPSTGGAITANKTITGAFIGNTYTMSFSNAPATGATVTTSQVQCTVTSGSSCNVTLPSTGYSYSGWTFNGWGTATNSTSGSSAGSSIPLTSNVTRYATWIKPEKVNTVAFANTLGSGGSVVSDAVSCTIPAAYNGGTQDTTCVVTLPSRGYSYPGWTFNGWGSSNTSTSGVTGEIYITTTQTRYATWIKEERFTVTYDCNVPPYGYSLLIPQLQGCDAVGYNGGKVSCTVNLNGGNGCSIPGPWIYHGLSTTAGSTSASIFPGSEMELTSNITLYTVQSKLVRVSVNGNGCSAGTIIERTLYNGAQSMTVTPSLSTYPGWTDKGYSKTQTDVSGSQTFSFEFPADQNGDILYHHCQSFVMAEVDYSCNGGTGSPADSSCSKTLYNGEPKTCAINLPSSSACTRSGWTFNGWGTSSSSVIGNTGTIQVSGDETRYAIWKKTATRTVNYSCNGGTGSVTPTTCTETVYNGAGFSGCSVTLATSGCSRSGWTFNGWGSSTSATTGMSGGSTLPDLDTDLNLYAVWKKNVTVTYKANGCTTGDKTVTGVMYNGATTFAAPRPTGYTMNSGWTDTTPASTNVSIGLTSTTGTANFTCKKEATRRVTYSCNGGNGSVAASTCTDTAYNGGDFSTCSVTLATSGCSRSGWTFVGWGTSASSTTGMQAGSTIPDLDTDLNLYAVWKKTCPTYTVSFANSSGSGGSVTASSVSCTIPAVYNGATCATTCTVTLPTNGYSYSGWTFNGWSMSNSSTSGVTGAVVVSSNHTRYATWKKTVTRTLSYNCNGGGGATGASTCSATVYNGGNTGSCNVTLASNGCSKNNWTFNGWAETASSSSGMTSGTISIGADTTRYATWKKTATITFNKNGCTTANGSATATLYNGATSVSVTVPTHTMNTNWTDTTGSTKAVTVGVDATTASTTYTCTKAVTVTFNKNGCTAANGTATLNLVNGAMSGVVTVPAHTTNSGWTDTTGTTKTISDIASESKTASTNFTCSKTFTVSFSKGSNVASIGATSSSCTVYNGSTSGCTVTYPSITANTGYTSVGWGTSSGATSGVSPGNYTATASSTRVANATDQTAPTCGTVGNSSTEWRKTAQTLTVACNETGGSGCSRTTFSQSFTETRVGYITISDNAGNTRDCPVNAYVDTTAPSISCTVNSSGANGVSVTVSASEGTSGLTQNPSGTSTITSTTSFVAKNGAGFQKSCVVTVTKTATRWTQNRYSCTNGSYSSGGSTYTKSCTARTKAEADSLNASSYWTCNTTAPYNCSMSSPCYTKTTYNRSSCLAYSSSAGSTSTNLTSCTPSSTSYYKYTCTETAWTYSGST